MLWGRGGRGGRCVGWRALLLLPYLMVSFPMSPIRRPSRRRLSNNDMSGSVPSQLGALTKLTQL